MGRLLHDLRLCPALRIFCAATPTFAVINLSGAVRLRTTTRWHRRTAHTPDKANVAGLTGLGDGRSGGARLRAAQTAAEGPSYASQGRRVNGQPCARAEGQGGEGLCCRAGGMGEHEMQVPVAAAAAGQVHMNSLSCRKPKQLRRYTLRAEGVRRHAYADAHVWEFRRGGEQIALLGKLGVALVEVRSVDHCINADAIF